MRRTRASWHGVLAITTLALVALLALPAAAFAVSFYLPWTQGMSYTCTQGNGGSTSHTGTYNQYAWDFGLGFGDVVRASAPGTVIGLNRTAADFVSNPNLSTPVNYVLIAHSDGTRTGYYHLKQYSLPSDIQLNSSVRQGQVVGGAGCSGFSFGTHLHFSRYNSSGASIPLTFVEYGVPAGGGRYTSGNVEQGAVVRYNPIAPGDPGFTKGGSASGWTSFAGGALGTAIYTYVSPSARDNWGRWTFDLSKLSGSGNYKIEAFIPSTNAGTRNAVYHINTGAGSRDKSVNQFATSGWTDLGTYDLRAGSAWIELDDVTGEVNRGDENSRIAFDAIRVTYAAPAKLDPVGGVVLSRSTTSTVGQSLSATFTVQNTGSQTATWDGAVLAVRAPGDLNRDFGLIQSFTLSPGQRKTFSVSRKLDLAGNWYGWVAVRKNGVWSTVGPNPAVQFAVALPKATVYTPVAPATMSRGRRYSISGYVAPRHSSGTYLATLQFYRRNSAGEWVYHHSSSARRYYYSTTKTRYSASVALPHTGKWRVRAQHSDSGHSPSYSGFDYISVR